MYSEITKELLEASAHIEDMRAELAAKKAKKKSTMEKLNYRFPSSVKSGCSMLSESMDCKWNESEIARAAMYLGLKQINEVLQGDKNKANGLMHVIKLRAGLGK